MSCEQENKAIVGQWFEGFLGNPGARRSSTNSPHRIFSFSTRCMLAIDIDRPQDRARRSARSSSQSDRSRSSSIAAWVRFHTGTAATRRTRPGGVNVTRRVRLSASSIVTLTSPRRSRGFKLAVNVVRSIASRADTLPMVGGSSRLSDISSENCPFVRPNGRSAASKRRATARAARCKCRQRQVSRTSTVIAKGRCWSLDTGSVC